MSDVKSGTEQFKSYMEIAKDLAGQTKAGFLPNPPVAALVIKDGKIIGKGVHQRCGEPHAEVLACKDAGQKLKGATLVVTLEPCGHHGKTPPCADLILREGFHTVVYGLSDPVEGHGGAEKLRNEGLRVFGPMPVPGLRSQIEPFVKLQQKQESFFTLKWAMTLDGKTASRSGDSQWITDEEARMHVHVERQKREGILVGVETLLKDLPSLDARYELKGPSPRPVVWDPLGKSRVAREWFEKQTPRNPMVLVSEDARVFDWPGGTQVVVCERLADIGRVLFQEKLYHVLVEGGATLHGLMLDAGVADRVLAYIAPKILGGQDAKGAVLGDGADSMEQIKNLRDVCMTAVGKDIVVEGLL